MKKQYEEKKLEDDSSRISSSGKQTTKDSLKLCKNLFENLPLLNCYSENDPNHGGSLSMA